MARLKELSTKAKREAIAAQITEIAASEGATVRRDPSTWAYAPRKILLRISINSYWVAISLDGDSYAGSFLAHWNTDGHIARYPDDFGFVVRGSVNTFHYGKATTCCDTLEQFYEAVRRGLARCKSLE